MTGGYIKKNLFEENLDNISDLEIKRIYFLQEEIKKHSHKYYNLANPDISDEQYDELFRELKLLEAKYPDITKDDSPTQKVGAPLTGRLKKIAHNLPMLSLDNVFNEQELIKFISSICTKISIEQVDFICEPKIDGLALSLVYENRKLSYALTRGDGVIGEDITHNALMIKSIPKELPEEPDIPDYLEIRGEAFFYKDDFIKMNTQEGMKFSNARNAAAGTLRILDSNYLSNRPLSFIAYSVYGKNEGYYSTQEATLKNLLKANFVIQDNIKKIKSSDECQNFYEYLLNKRNDLPYEIDGLVIKVNEKKYQTSLGETTHSPRWAVAYKFPANKVNTVLENVSFQIGRTGVLTPVAQLKPVNIDGATVSNASLHNRDEIKRLGLRIGDNVEVCRSGDVIPKVLRVIYDKRPLDTKDIIEPTHCLSCNTKLVISQEQGSNYYCPAGIICPAQKLHSLIHFCSRNAMNIVGLGEQLIIKLYNIGKLNSFVDIFKLEQKDFLELPNIKDKLSNKLVSAIDLSRNVTLDKFIFSLGIIGVGEVASKNLAEYFKSFERIKIATYEELLQVVDIGDITAKSIYSFLNSQDKEHKINLDELVNYLKIENPSSSVDTQNEYVNGKNIVITGTLDRPRDFYSKALIKNGANMTSTISSKVDMLIIGREPGSKLMKAQKLGLQIVSEDILKKWLKID